MKKLMPFLLLSMLYGCEQSVETNIEPVANIGPPQQGVVLETIDVESYTYMRLNVAGAEMWIASTPTQAGEGDIVRFDDSVTMNNFRSEVLDRTFEEILFVSRAEVVGAHPVDVSALAAELPQNSNPHNSLGSNAAIDSVSLTVIPLEGGLTIAEIYVQSEQLEGQQISLRGQVTKFSPNILGKNWITLQDGTGSAPDNSLIVTTVQTASIGDQLVVTGTVTTNVDIGAGYTYKVLLEEASITL